MKGNFHTEDQKEKFQSGDSKDLIGDPEDWSLDTRRLIKDTKTSQVPSKTARIPRQIDASRENQIMNSWHRRWRV